jgi:putative phage-type endonuclease
VTTLVDQPQLQLVLPSGATQVMPPDVARPVWLAERRRSIGGSDASTLVDLNPHGSRMQLWLDKTGQLPEQRVSSAIEWGNLLEPVVREWLAQTYRLTIVRCGMLRRPGQPRVHANPDGIVLDEHSHPVMGVEIKTTSHRMAHEWADGQVPDHAELQAQLCMHVTGLSSWWVVGLIDGRDPQVRKVHADPELGDMLAAEAARFYRDHIDPMQPPALDDSEATYDAVRGTLSHATDGKAIRLTPDLLRLLAAREKACAAVQAAEAARREADAALCMALGDAAEIVDDPDLPADRKPSEGGRTIYATWVNNGTFAANRFAEEQPELVEEFTVDRAVLDVAALKANRPEIYQQYRARPLRTRKALADALATMTPTTNEDPA